VAVIKLSSRKFRELMKSFPTKRKETSMTSMVLMASKKEAVAHKTWMISLVVFSEVWAVWVAVNKNKDLRKESLSNTLCKLL